MTKKQTIKKPKEVIKEPETVVVIPKPTLKNPIECPWCNGTGMSYHAACPKCKGAKQIEFY